jgi:hypothetical protein
LFLFVASSVFASVHYYAWARLIRDVQLPSPWFEMATVLMVVMALFIPLSRVILRGSDGIEKLLSYPTFIWMGSLFITLFVLLGTDLIRLLLSLTAPQLQPDARTWALITLTTVVALVVGSVLQVGRGPHIKTVEITLPRLTLEKVADATAAQAAGGSDTLAIDCDTGQVTDMWQAGVIDPAQVKIHAVKAALEIAEAILRINAIIRRKEDNPVGSEPLMHKV